MGNCLGSSAKVDTALSSNPTSASGFSKIEVSSQTVPSINTPPPVLPITNQFKSSFQTLPTPRTEDEILSAPGLKHFTLNELKCATRNFRPDNLLGEGGFGCVYKGWIDEQTLAPTKSGSGMVIAVKKLKPEGFQGHKEWLSTVSPELVKLIGYWLEGDNRLLVYEFMPKGSLENHLFRISYLFYGNRVIWRLLLLLLRRALATSVDFNAKLSDFGLAKAGPTGDRTHVSTQVVGTQGYAAPEYVATGRLTVKSDVYSFGVVLLELLTGCRPLDRSKPAIDQNLAILGEKRKLFRIMDTKLEGQYLQKEAFDIATLALRCLCSQPKPRPDMVEVLNELEKLQDQKTAAECSQTQPKNASSTIRGSPLRQQHTPVNLIPSASPLP
ncbi:putative serine/threonine-protein kinase PBL3 [Drosera capensis]